MSNTTATETGIIITRHRKNYIVESADGRLIDCSARRKTSQAVCGDRVLWEASGDTGTLTQIIERESLLARPDQRGQMRAIAANVNQLMIVFAVERNAKPDDLQFNRAMIDRYLVAAEAMDTQPIIVINKIDRLADEHHDAIRLSLADYTKLGYPLLLTSTKTAHGLNALLAQLPDKISIFTGESGVGKSSLINLLLPEEDIRVGAVSEASGLGRHTTSNTTLYHLKSGGDLIDSPGIREFGLWDINKKQLATGFRDFHPYLGECKFRNCRHDGEKGCAIGEAVDEGKISLARYRSYVDMLEKLEQT